MNITEATKIIKYTCKKYHIKFTDDILQDGYVAYLNAFKLMDANRKDYEKTKYVFQSILYALTKKPKKHGWQISRQVLPSTRLDNQEELRWVWKRLSKKEKVIFKDRANGLNLRDIAVKFNVSHQRIHTIIKDVQKRFNQYYDSDN